MMPRAFEIKMCVKIGKFMCERGKCDICVILSVFFLCVCFQNRNNAHIVAKVM